MKTNTELRASLSMVLARLDSDPKSASEWQAMEAALSQSLAYVRKTKEMRAFVGRTRPSIPMPRKMIRCHWREVQLWSAEDMWAGPASYDSPASKDGRTGDRADVLRLMREYKRTGAIQGAYLADPDDYLDDDDHVVVAINDAGPTVDSIDWTDIDNA